MVLARPVGSGRSHLVAAVGWLIALGAVFAGVGLIYLMRQAGIAGAGPEVGGVLPLQQLARGESEPLLRVLIGWLLAGTAAGLALRFLSRAPLLARLSLLAVLAWLVLLLTGAESDAVVISGSLGGHLAPQLSRTGIWMGAGVLAAAAAAASLPWRRRDLGAGASG